MMTACELCAKVTAIEIEKALREEINKREKAKTFVEEVISPIVDTLTVIPKDLWIGYLNLSGYLCGNLTEWKDYVTHCGNPASYRKFVENPYVPKCNIRFENLNCDLVNEYLKDFGFYIRVERKTFTVTKYTTTTSDAIQIVDAIYLSMICPMEE